MAKIAFQNKRFKTESLNAIVQANGIINEYMEQGYSLTLRQLYYQFVARDFIENSQRAYKRLGDLINNARLAGLIDWDAIEDRTRNLERLSHWDNPGQIIDAVADQYRVDKWAEQPYRVEVWIEKEALAGVIGQICNRLDVAYFACRGYVSQSEMYAAASRLARFRNNGQSPVIIHLGDHDPSGLDMTRDIIDRLLMFTGGGIDVKRIALNMDQIDEFKPPPNPAKVNDSRFSDYQARFGRQSWELDALSPEVLDRLITGAVDHYRDRRAWQNAMDLETTHKRILERVRDNWETI